MDIQSRKGSVYKLLTTLKNGRQSFIAIVVYATEGGAVAKEQFNHLESRVETNTTIVKKSKIPIISRKDFSRCFLTLKNKILNMKLFTKTFKWNKI